MQKIPYTWNDEAMAMEDIGSNDDGDVMSASRLSLVLALPLLSNLRSTE